MNKYLEYLRVLAPLAVIGVVLVVVSVLLGGCSSQTPEESARGAYLVVAEVVGMNEQEAMEFAKAWCAKDSERARRALEAADPEYTDSRASLGKLLDLLYPYAAEAECPNAGLGRAK